MDMNQIAIPLVNATSPILLEYELHLVNRQEACLWAWVAISPSLAM